MGIQGTHEGYRKHMATHATALHDGAHDGACGST